MSNSELLTVVAAVLGTGGLGGGMVSWLRYRKDTLKQTAQQDLDRDKWIDGRIKEYTEGLRTQLNASNTRIGELEGDVARLRTEVREGQGMIHNLETDNTSLRNTTQELILTKSQQDARILHLESDRIRLKAENQFLHEHIRRLPLPLQVTGALPPPPPLASMLVNPEGHIIEADEDADRLYGGKLVGATVLDIVPARFHPSHLSGFVRAVLEEVVPEHPSRFVLLRANGEELHVTGKIALVMMGSRRCFSVQIQPEDIPVEISVS